MLEPTKALVAAVRASGVPVIYFGNGATTILDRIAAVGADVYGIDWRLPLDEARARLGGAAAVQGNLDPVGAARPDRRDRAPRGRRRPARRRARAHLQPGPRHHARDPDRRRRGAGADGAGGVGRAVAKPADTLAIVALNLGGPDSLDAVEPFLRNLFADPDVIQLGPLLRPVQPLIARFIARRRAPLSRAAYAQIGGRSPILGESTDQAKAIAAELVRRGHAALPFVAMACWKPFSADAVAAIRAAGIHHAVAVPLYPHYSITTTGSSFKALERAAAGTSVEHRARRAAIPTPPATSRRCATA